MSDTVPGLTFYIASSSYLTADDIKAQRGKLFWPRSHLFKIITAHVP